MAKGFRRKRKPLSIKGGCRATYWIPTAAKSWGWLPPVMRRGRWVNRREWRRRIFIWLPAHSHRTKLSLLLKLALSYRADRLRRQSCHRRLLARRRRYLDRERRVKLS